MCDSEQMSVFDIMNDIPVVPEEQTKESDNFQEEEEPFLYWWQKY